MLLRYLNRARLRTTSCQSVGESKIPQARGLVADGVSVIHAVTDLFHASSYRVEDRLLRKLLRFTIAAGLCGLSHVHFLSGKRVIATVPEPTDTVRTQPQGGTPPQGASPGPLRVLLLALRASLGGGFARVAFLSDPCVSAGLSVLSSRELEAL